MEILGRYMDLLSVHDYIPKTEVVYKNKSEKQKCKRCTGPLDQELGRGRLGRDPCPTRRVGPCTSEQEPRSKDSVLYTRESHYVSHTHGQAGP